METQAAREILAAHIKRSGRLRETPERFAVLDAVLESHGHFDAEGLYFRMISSGIKVSKATVYNTLDLLQECGLVSKYRFTENSSRYEKAFGRPSHHHLICLSCGEIIEFINDKLERIQDEVSTEKNFKPQSSNLQIFGTCAKCRKRG
jgi:Fur family ferric uptake transcriptional regulator